MRTFRKSGVTALTAAIALSLGAVPAALTATSILADGEGTTTLESASVSVGTLTLNTSSSQGTVSWNGITETFTGGQQCEIVWANGSPSLLNLTADGSTDPKAVAGFREGQIGVYEPAADGSPTNASQCFRIDFGSFTDNETLTLSLGNNPGFTEQFGNTTSQLLVSKASVTYAANSQSGSFDVKDSAGNAVAASPATSWGPKTKSGTQFTTVLTPSSVTSGFRLKSTSGSFSVVKATFDLVSQRDATFCNPGNPGGQSTYTEGTTTVNYLGNADSSNSCFGIQLTSGNRSYQWLKPLTVSPDAQFTFRQDWTIADPFPSSPDYSLPKAYVNFEILYPGTTATAPPIPSVDHEMDFCPPWMYGSDGSIALVTDADGLAKLKALDMESDVVGVPGSIDTQFACINKFKRTTEIKTTGLLVKDTIYLIGDANFRF